jgi:hypothetical protein
MLSRWPLLDRRLGQALVSLFWRWRFAALAHWGFGKLRIAPLTVHLQDHRELRFGHWIWRNLQSAVRVGVGGVFVGDYIIFNSRTRSQER